MVRLAKWQLGFAREQGRVELFFERVRPSEPVQTVSSLSSPPEEPAPQAVTRTEPVQYMGVSLDNIPIPDGEDAEDYRDWLHWEAELRERGAEGDPDFDEVICAYS